VNEIDLRFKCEELISQKLVDDIKRVRRENDNYLATFWNVWQWCGTISANGQIKIFPKICLTQSFSTKNDLPKNQQNLPCVPSVELNLLLTVNLSQEWRIAFRCPCYNQPP
jgi:hypothetical protein